MVNGNDFHMTRTTNVLYRFACFLFLDLDQDLNFSFLLYRFMEEA